MRFGSALIIFNTPWDIQTGLSVSHEQFSERRVLLPRFQTEFVNSLETDTQWKISTIMCLFSPISHLASFPLHILRLHPVSLSSFIPKIPLYDHHERLYNFFLALLPTTYLSLDFQSLFFHCLSCCEPFDRLLFPISQFTPIDALCSHATRSHWITHWYVLFVDIEAMLMKAYSIVCEFSLMTNRPTLHRAENVRYNLFPTLRKSPEDGNQNKRPDRYS
jgi:hypothetical protein